MCTSSKFKGGFKALKMYPPTTLLSSLARYRFHIRLLFSSSLRQEVDHLKQHLHQNLPNQKSLWSKHRVKGRNEAFAPFFGMQPSFRILEMTCRRTGFWLTSNGQSPRQTTSDGPSPCSPRCEGRPTESAEILGRPADCRGRRRLFRTYVLKQIYLTGCFKNVCTCQTVFFF